METEERGKRWKTGKRTTEIIMQIRQIKNEGSEARAMKILQYKTSQSQTKESERERERERKKNAYESALLLLCYSLTGEGKKSRIKSECLYFILGFKLNAPLFFFRIFVSIFNNAFHIFLKFSERFKKKGRKERGKGSLCFALHVTIPLQRFHFNDSVLARCFFIIFNILHCREQRMRHYIFPRIYKSFGFFYFPHSKKCANLFPLRSCLLESLMNVFGVHSLKL